MSKLEVREYKQSASNSKQHIMCLISRLFSYFSRPEQNTVWLLGDGRSGTTWLAYMINFRRNYRFMFEPFHPKVSTLHEPFQYLRPETPSKYLSDSAKLIFSGQFFNPRVDQFSHMGFHKGLLIKDIFMHLLAKWIDNRFPKIKKILLLRHPCAVAISKKKLRKHADWAIDTRRFLTNPDLVQDFLHPFANLIASTSTDFQELIVNWCIIHYVPLHQFERDNLHLVFYEDLCTNPEREIQRILSFLNNLDISNLKPMLESQFHIPSPTTRKDSVVLTNQNNLDWWYKELTKTEITEATQILRDFGLDQIYSGDTLLPNRIAAENILLNTTN